MSRTQAQHTYECRRCGMVCEHNLASVIIAVVGLGSMLALFVSSAA